MRSTGPSRIGRVEALSIKRGPTESGIAPPPHTPVGGELIPIDKLSVFLSNFWLLIILILFLPAVIMFYRKRNVLLKFLSPLIFRFFEYKRML